MSESKDNITPFKELANEVFYLDLGRKAAFMSFSDINKFGKDPIGWPCFTKEDDPKKQGALNCGRSPVENRLNAAKAYALMLQVGETKAALCAGRWLACETQTSSGTYEKMVRKKLQCVSDEEQVVECTNTRPPFCSVYVKRISDQEMKEWAFGARTNTRAVLSRVNRICTSLGEGWVPVCTGSRCLGFTTGDFDIVIYNTNTAFVEENLVRELSALSTTARTKLLRTHAGTLLQINDVATSEGKADIDCVISKDGESAHAKVAQQGLFLERLLITHGYLPLFYEIKEIAKSFGIIDATSGFLNTYAMMLVIIEFLVIRKYITIDIERPLYKQDPICMAVSDHAKFTLVRDFFEWLQTNLASPDYVFFSFNDPRWNKRGNSEFVSNINYRVCRDPFAFGVDNPMRTVQNTRIKELLCYCKHAQYCRQRERHMVESRSICDREASVGDMLDSVMMKPATDAPMTMTIIPMDVFVFISQPRGAFGVSRTEGVARARCASNQLRVFNQIYTLCWGISVIKEYGTSGLTVIEALKERDRLYVATPEEGIWCVGFCSVDNSSSDDYMEPLDIRGLEILLQFIQTGSNDIPPSYETDE